MIAGLINFAHILLVIFIIFTPFFGNEYFLTLHVIIIPFIVLHWITNQSVCALTEIEKIITNKKLDDETFFGKLVGPVYKFRTKDEETLFLYGLMGCLFTITFIKLKQLGFVQLKADWAHLTSLLRTPQIQPSHQSPSQNPSPSQPPLASQPGAQPPSWEGPSQTPPEWEP